MEPNVADLRNFKLWILLDQIIRVWNIKGLQHWVLKILRFKYLILFQRLNSFEEFFIQRGSWCINCPSNCRFRNIYRLNLEIINSKFSTTEAIPSIITFVNYMTSLNCGRTVVNWIIYLSDKNLAWDIWRPNYRPPKYDHCSYIWIKRTGSDVELKETGDISNSENQKTLEKEYYIKAILVTQQKKSSSYSIVFWF